MNIFNICIFFLAATAVFAQSPTPAAIQVMILGTYHFGNPGLDLHNMKSESVLTPVRQKELDDIATRLAKFNPTKIAVEAQSDRPDFGTQKFADFTRQKLTTDPDERTQIAFRLAERLSHKNVYGMMNKATRSTISRSVKLKHTRKPITRLALLLECTEMLKKT